MPDTVTSKRLACYHCGEICKNSDISVDDRVFCCHGCRMVYELLAENNLCDYYALTEKPGVKSKNGATENNFAYLDDEKIAQKLLDFSDSNLSTVTFHIPQMHCSACIWLLENLYKLHPGIGSSKVNFLRKELSLSFRNEKTSLRHVVELLDAIGYTPLITFDSLDKKTRTSSNKSLYLKIGVAGFAFGNIMLLSFPAYLASGTGIEPTFSKFFGYLCLLLALPVLLYSSRDYFASARSGLQQKIINMDVPISLGIVTLFVRSVYEIVAGGGPGYLDSFAGLVFLLLVGKVFQKKTYDALSFDRDYKAYFPISVTRMRDKREQPISLAELQIGDRILVRNQELIPADAVLISERALIDYSFVTGESAPVQREQGNLLFAGGRQIGSAIVVEIIKEVSQSYLTQLWNNDVFSKPKTGSLASITNTVSKYFTFTTILIAAASALYWLPSNSHLAINAFTAVLIIACPCALALSTPFTLGNALRIFGKNKFYLKNTEVIETLAKIDTLVFDKTGTLTQSRLAAVDFVAAEQTGGLTDTEKQLVKSLVQQSTHPLSHQIGAALAAENALAVTDFHEEHGLGIEGQIAGEKIKIGSRAWMNGAAASNHLGPSGATETPATRVYCAIGDRLRGFFRIRNTYRDNLQEVVSGLQKKYELTLLSGDNDHEKATLQEVFGPGAQLHFNQSPYAKLEFIQQQHRAHKKVLMIGDGLNDAGALQQSDVGISISDDITAFSPACDGILEGRRFSHFDTFLQFARTSLDIVYLSFGISFLYNVVGLSFAVQGTLSPLISAILMPLSSISVVAFATFSTNLAARKAGL